MIEKSQNLQESKIVDFESVLDSLLVDENHVWGKKNKPRNEEPDMYFFLLNIILYSSLTQGLKSWPGRKKSRTFTTSNRTTEHY